MKNWLLIQASKIKKFGSEKALTLTVTKLNELLVQSLSETIGPEDALEKVFEGGMSLGHEFMMELSAVLEKNVERVPAYGEAAWMMFAGKTPTEQTFEKLTVEGEEVWKYTLRDDDNPFCRNIAFPRRFCQFPAGAYQGASQTWAALTHNGDLHTLCRETKCKAVGDEYCEFTLVIVNKEIPIEFMQRHMPEMFEDIKTGFIDY